MIARTHVGTVAGLWRYPIKSLAGQPVQSSYLDENGLAGDRRAALFLATPDQPRTGKTVRGKEQPRFHTASDAGVARKLAPSLDLDVREDGPYFDAQPVSLIFDRWLEELEQICGRHIEALRFRPNVLVRARADVPPEAELAGRRLRIGNVVLLVLQPITRCITPSYDLETGASSTEILRGLVHVRKNLMGIYCRVEQAGALAMGDSVHALNVASR
jgi:uncharacterized protein YcbX